MLLVVLGTGCTGRLPADHPPLDQRLRLSPETVAQLPLLYAMLTRVEVRRLIESGDPDAWLEAYWEAHDPSPSTPENELQEILLQRAAYLQQRFDESDLARLPEPWATFLRDGPWVTAQADVHPIYSESVTYRLSYRVPIPHRRVVDSAGVPVPGLTNWLTTYPPRLDGAWSTLLDVTAPRAQRIRALRGLAWYETPAVAGRLLTQPSNVFSGLQPEWDDMMLLMAARISYLGGQRRTQRVAALTAIDEPPRFILGRSLLGSYTVEEFRRDLSTSHRLPGQEQMIGLPDPDPRLWSDPEGLFERLLEEYPSAANLTGWDWPGDFTLTHGPPAFIQTRPRTATLLFGVPQILEVTGYSAGRVHTRVVRDPLQDFREQVWNREEVGAVEEQTVRALELLEAGGGARVTSELIESVRSMIRQRSYSVEIEQGGSTFPLYADAAVFPRIGTSADILLTLGVATSDVASRSVRGRQQTDLQTSCLLLDDAMSGTRQYRHTGGYVFQPTSSEERLPFIVDSYSLRAAAGRHLYYLSSLDPTYGTSSGYLLEVRVPGATTEGGPVLSSLLLAADVSESPEPGGVRRAGSRIVPYPGRNLYYSEPLWLYFEIQGLQPSEYGDRRWEESYYIVPEAEGVGIMRLHAVGAQSTIRERAERFFLIDLQGLEGGYEGPIFLLVAVRDVRTGHSGIAAAHLDLAAR